MIPEIDRVTDPSYTAGLSALAIDEVRARRHECDDLENAVSYVRRFAQARLDLVAAVPDPQAGSASEPLTGNSTDQGGHVPLNRPPRGFEPGPHADALLVQLDAILGPSQLAEVDAADASTLTRLIDGLSEFEAEISRHRRALHEVLDALQAEIVRRYKTGEASVDTLLSDS